MKVIGITGGIASGKSTASKYIMQKGYRVFDADAVSRSLTEENGAALPKITQVFGAHFIKDNTLDRRLMSREVFSDPSKRKMLEEIIHPLVMSACKQDMLACADEQLFFLDVPLLFESGMDALCDEVWLISSPQRERIERLKRRGLDPTEAKKRIRSQMPEYKKRKLAHHVIDSSGEKEQTRARIDRLITRALKNAGADKKIAPTSRRNDGE